ncbi:MAG: hypothetical protein ACKO34_06765 [Vampirovibrionales bacterium]
MMLSFLDNLTTFSAMALRSLGVFEFVSVRSILVALIVGILLLLVQSVRVRWEASPLASSRWQSTTPLPHPPMIRLFPPEPLLSKYLAY